MLRDVEVALIVYVRDKSDPATNSTGCRWLYPWLHNRVIGELRSNAFARDGVHRLHVLTYRLSIITAGDPWLAGLQEDRK